MCEQELQLKFPCLGLPHKTANSHRFAKMCVMFIQMKSHAILFVFLPLILLKPGRLRSDSTTRPNGAIRLPSHQIINIFIRLAIQVATERSECVRHAYGSAIARHAYGYGYTCTASAARVRIHSDAAQRKSKGLNRTYYVFFTVKLGVTPSCQVMSNVLNFQH